MKKILSIILITIQLFAISVSADTLSIDKINSTNQIGGFTVAVTNEGEYLLDGQSNILGGPYELISNYDDFPYAQKFDGSWEMYDIDGKVFAQVGKEGETCGQGGHPWKKRTRHRKMAAREDPATGRRRDEVHQPRQ